MNANEGESWRIKKFERKSDKNIHEPDFFNSYQKELFHKEN